MLKTDWNLDKLYTSLESEEYKKDKELLVEEITNLTEFIQKQARELSQEEVLVGYIKRLEKVMKFETLFGYVSLYITTHSSSSEYLKEEQRLNKIYNTMALPETLFIKYVGEIRTEDLEKLIIQNEYLKTHKMFLTEKKEISLYTLSEKEEILLSKLKDTGSRAYSNLRDSYVSNLMQEVEINGKIESLNFPALRNLAFSSDEEVRKAGYLGELEALGKFKKTVAASLNGIKGEVITVSETRGYKSPLDYTLQSQRMDKKTLDTMLEAMREFLPEFERYFLKKADMLGHKNGLPFYDLFAPVGNSNMTFTYEQASDLIIESFGEFSKELSDFAKHAFENQWIDAIPKENKREGAFCHSIHTIGESRILSNFGGDYTGLTTLAHELGHGYHGHCLKTEPILNSDYPMPLAETASIFCETIIKNNALKYATDEQKLTILENSLQDSSQVIVDILSRFIFEDVVFKNRINGSLTAEELDEIMINAQKEAYGKGLDENYLHKYMWIVKGHYYDADYNYYNFPYAFGLLFATGLYAIYQEQPYGFLDKYKKLLRDTGKMNIYEVAKSVGIDLHDKQFYLNSLNVIKNEIDEFVKL